MKLASQMMGRSELARFERGADYAKAQLLDGKSVKAIEEEVDRVFDFGDFERGILAELRDFKSAEAHWQPISTAPKDGTRIAFRNVDNGLGDFGEWYEFSGEAGGDWSTDLGNGDMTHWQHIARSSTEANSESCEISIPIEEIGLVLRDVMQSYTDSRAVPGYAVEVALWFVKKRQAMIDEKAEAIKAVTAKRDAAHEVHLEETIAANTVYHNGGFLGKAAHNATLIKLRAASAAVEAEYDADMEALKAKP